MFSIVGVPSGKEIEACAKFVIGDYEVSITSHRHPGLCVYRNGKDRSLNLTERIFGEPETYPDPDKVAKALIWCQEAARLAAEPSGRSREEKLRLLSDYHKDFYGWRPDTSRMTEDEILAAWDKITAEFEEKKKTPEGRQWLRDRHWCVDEPQEAGV